VLILVVGMVVVDWLVCWLVGRSVGLVDRLFGWWLFVPKVYNSNIGVFFIGWKKSYFYAAV